MRKVLRRPGFRWLFAGMCFSMTAESILLLALAIWVKSLTGSDGMAGATIFAVVAPMTLAPFVGYFVDRFRRKPFLVAALLASAVLLTPLFLVHDRSDVWIIYTVAVGYGLSFISVSSALNALVKEVVPDELLAEANGALQTVKQGLRLIAPLVGAGLYVSTKGWGLAVTGIAGFLLAALVISFLQVPVAAARKPSELNWFGEVSVGVRHLVKSASLRRTVLGVITAILVFGFSESATFALVDKGLHRPPEFLAVLLTFQGIGGLIGGLIAAPVVRRFGEIGTTALGIVLFVPLTIAALWPTLWTIMPLAAVGGIGLPLIIVGLMTLMQRITPGEILGRVSAATDALLSGPQALSIGLGAVLVSQISFKVLFTVMAIVLALSAVYLWTGRHLSPPAEPAPAEPIAPAQPVASVGAAGPAGDQPVGDGAAVRQPESAG
jgi:MFS family permease